jgi:hypothetical protein
MTTTTVPAESLPAPVPAVRAPQPDLVPLERGTRLRRRAAGITAIAAGALSLAGILTCPWENAPGEAAYLESLLRDPTMAMVSMVLLHWGYLLFVPVIFVLARLARRRSPKLAATGLVLGVIGSGLSGFLVTDAYDLAIAQGLPLDKAAQISDSLSPLGIFAMSLPTVAGITLGLVLVFAAMWRARFVSWVPGLAVLAGWVVGYGAHTLLQAGIGMALVAAAFAWMGIRILRLTDAQFVAGTADRA